MGAIQQIFHRFGPEYLAHFGEHIPTQHHKVIEGRLPMPHRGLWLGLLPVRGLWPSSRVPAAAATAIAPSANTTQPSSGLAGTATPTARPPIHAHLHGAPAPARVSPQPPRLGYDALFAASSQAIKALVLHPRFLGPTKPASSACSTPGADGCSITHTSTHWCRAGHSPSEDAPGMPPAPASSCRESPFTTLRGKFGALIRKADCSIKSLPKPGSRTGTSTARRSPAPRPRSSISPPMSPRWPSRITNLNVEKKTVSFSYKKPGTSVW